MSRCSLAIPLGNNNAKVKTTFHGCTPTILHKVIFLK